MPNPAECAKPGRPRRARLAQGEPALYRSRVAEGGSKGLFRTLLETLDLAPPEGNAALDVVLTVALADGDFTGPERDAVERALAEGALGETTWEAVLSRADELEADAPFFTETRAHLLEARWPAEAKTRALAAAARVGSAGTPLADEQRAFFYTLAEGLGFDEATVEGLLPPWGFALAPAEEVGWVRPRFSDPDAREPANLFDALARARGEELRALAFKLSAPRDLASLELEGAKITEVGATVDLGDARLRIDAIVEAEGVELWVRCLARGEALYPAERRLFPSLLTTLADHQRLAIAYQDRLTPADAAAISNLDPHQLLCRAV